MMKRLKRKQMAMALAMLLLIGMLLPIDLPKVRAAEGGTLSVSGLEAGDEVGVYRIASYVDESESYVWEPAVKDWLLNKNSGRVYRSLTTDQMVNMTPERIKEFCEVLITSLKIESSGLVNVEGERLYLGQDEGAYRIDIEPGYYIVLPKGTDRIYELKWFVAGPGQNPFVSYEEGDYQIPSISGSLVNATADRGLVKDLPFCLRDDELKVTVDLQIPHYAKSYATGKRIYNTTIVIPQGLTYKKDSLGLEGLTGGSDFSVGEYVNSTVYETTDHVKLFFGTESGFYYEMDGSVLASSGTAQDAMDAYNDIYETGYRLPEPRKLAISSLEEKGADMVATEGLEAATEALGTTEETSSEIAEEETIIDYGDGLTLLEKKRNTVLVVAINTELDITSARLSYVVTKNTEGNESGIYNNQLILSYSISPLDSNALAQKIANIGVTAYGIHLVLCEGTGESISLTAEEKLQKSVRLTNACFYLYKLKHTYTGDMTSTEASTEDTSKEENEADGPSNGEQVIYYYDEDKNVSYEYEFVEKLFPDNYGEVKIGGLEEAEYLLTQVLYPIGYTRSLESIVIYQTDWTNESLMQDRTQLQLIWLDYEPAYLVGTGKIGIVPYAISGGFIAGLALLILFDRNYHLGIFSRIQAVGVKSYKVVTKEIKKKFRK